MSAIGKLLDRADAVRRFFDGVLDYLPDSPPPRTAAEAQRCLSRYADPQLFRSDNADLIGTVVEPPYRSLITPERWLLLGRWGSEDALFVAALRGVTDEPNGQWDLRSLEAYVAILDERNRLLDSGSLQELLVAALDEAREWGPLAPVVVQRAESLVDALHRLSSREMNTRERWRREREAVLEPAERLVRGFARRQADPPTEPTSEDADEPTQPELQIERKARTEEELARDKELALAWVQWSIGRPKAARRVKAFLFEMLKRQPTEEEVADARRAINSHHAAKKSRAKNRNADASDMTHL